MENARSEKSLRKAAQAKAWREKFKANDPEGFREYTRRKSAESYRRLDPDKKKKRHSQAAAWNEAWKARDPEGFRAYRKVKDAEHVARLREPGAKRKTTLVNGCNVGDNYFLARRLIKHGISLDDYDAMFDKTPGCGICRKVPERKYSLHIDHDHETGRVRGLLCSRCNSGLGKLGDNVAGLRAAIEYLGG